MDVGPRLKWFLAGLAVALALAGAFIYVVLTNVRYSTTTAVTPAVDISEYVVKVGPHHYRIVKPVSQGEVPKLIKAGYYNWWFVAGEESMLENITDGWYLAFGLLQYCISTDLPRTEWAVLAVLNGSGIDVYVADVVSGEGTDQMIEVIKELSSERPLVIAHPDYGRWTYYLNTLREAWEKGRIYAAYFQSDTSVTGEEFKNKEDEILIKTAEFARRAFPGLFKEYPDLYSMGFDVYPLRMSLPRVIVFINGTVRAIDHEKYVAYNESVITSVGFTETEWLNELLDAAMSSR